MANTQNNSLVAVAEAIAQASTKTIRTVFERLSTEQRAALESKFNMLPIETRTFIGTDPRYIGLSIVEQYTLKQMIKEANGKLASNQRPVWYNKILVNAPSLKSGDKTVREYAEKELRTLAEDLDSKESTNLLRKYKNSHDMTTADPHIKTLCGIFGIDSMNLK